MTAYRPGSHNRLTEFDLARFAGKTLFDRIARAVCRAGCLPRKELYEAWELARRVRRSLRGRRVLDVAGGHGLLAHIMLLLDDSSPQAVVIDPEVPPCGAALHASMTAEWPRLTGRITYARVGAHAFTFTRDDLVVSSHACGSLTDLILERAASVHAPVAVLPCCHNVTTAETGSLGGWLDGALAVDVVRAVNLKARGYRVKTQTIPDAITPKNRLLIGHPE